MESTQQPYTVLARRFRPQTFDEVVGQEHIGQALRNAIRGGRVAHAYLFTGARGVGKTSTARIFAKALNCPNAVDGVPCNECEICRSIAAGSDVDVLEIDGASNRGIDDIRQLRANVNVRSMRSPNKVYLIDEVHMLTKEAFNALLKTLEEPPPNVKFIFCTTEPNKVPETILSRCQRFDFGTIASTSIAERLKQIAEAEQRQVDNDAVELIARRAAGSMRDSQSLFDQLLAFGSDHITSADVHRLMGTASDDRVSELIDSLIARDHAGALAQLEESLAEGVQLGSFSDQLLGYLRDLVVVSVGAVRVPLTAVSESQRGRLQQQAELWGLETITAAMQVLSEAKGRMQRVNYGRVLLELALVRMGQLEELAQLTAIASQLAAGGGEAETARPSVQKRQDSVSRLLPTQATVQPVSRRKESGEDAGQAKNYEAITRAEAQSIKDSVPQPVAEQKVPSEQHISFASGTLEILWSQVLKEAPDTLASHLKNAASRAISGPKTLEILFPKSYLFSKTYCERSESRQRLAEVTQRLTGEKVECRFEVDQSSQPPVQQKDEQPNNSKRLKANAVDADPFVQSVLKVFGGEVVEVRSVSGSEGNEEA